MSSSIWIPKPPTKMIKDVLEGGHGEVKKCKSKTRQISLSCPPRNMMSQGATSPPCNTKIYSTFVSPYQAFHHHLALVSPIAIPQLPPKMMYHPHKNLSHCCLLPWSLPLPSCTDISLCNSPCHYLYCCLALQTLVPLSPCAISSCPLPLITKTI